MTPFGVTDSGFISKRFDDLKSEAEEKFRSKFGEDIDLADDSPLGMIVAGVSELRADDWEAFQAVYNSFWPDLTSGIGIDRVGQFRAVVRRAESFSTGFVTFTGTPGVEILQGTRVQDAVGRQVETLVTAATDGTTGTVTVPVRAITGGPVTFSPGTLTTMATSVFGIDTVTNAESVTGGLARESDTEYRIRSAAAQQAPGTSSARGIKNAVNALSFVRDTIVAENELDGTDSEGRPGHSFETYVLTNLASTITNFPDQQLEIAQAIWNAKPGGIQSWGNVSAVITDDEGFAHTVRFTEAQKIDVVVNVTVLANTDPLEGDLFPLTGPDLIKEAVYAYGVTLSMGRDVWLNKIYSAASSVPGVKGVVSITINGVAANLAVAAIELPVFSIDNIGVTVQ